VEYKKSLDYLIEEIKVLNSVIIGPGLGRDEETLKLVLEVLKESLKSESRVYLLDADFLWFIS